MRTLRLFGMNINAVRDIFGASTALASRLRESAATSLPPPRHKPTSLLDKLGPLFKRAPATEVDPNRPSRDDVDLLLAGEYVPPERSRQSWHVLLLWLGELAACEQTITVDRFDDVEFDLARIGLSSEFSLRRLAERDLGVPLRPLPNQVAGYSRHQQAVDTHAELSRVLADPLDERPLSDATQATVTPLLEFLDQVSQHADADVVCVSVDELAP